MPGTPRAFVKRAALFVGVGLVIYAAVYAVSEALVYKYAKTNSFYKVRVAERNPGGAAVPASTTYDASSYDYLIVGSSHGMVFGFEDMNSRLEEMTGTRIINLAMTGAGVIPSRFLTEYFLKEHHTRKVLYIFDEQVVAFDEWNENRLSDSSLFKRAPFDPDLARLLATYAFRGKTSWSVVADYLLGFSKINNADRFSPDVSDLEKQFRQTFYPTERKYQQRIAYLFPRKVSDEDIQKHLRDLGELIEVLKARGIELIAMETPVPNTFYQLTPEAVKFDEMMKEWLESRGATLYNFSLVNNDERYFLDTDHLNREGVLRFYEKYLADVLTRHVKTN